MKMVKMKRCTKCKKLKDESEFSKDRRLKDGLRCWCKKCECEYIHQYYRRNSKSVKKYYRYEECHRVVGGVKEKRCRRCGKWKAESEFYKEHRHKDGLETRCKKCVCEAARKYREQRTAVRN